jgi:hypothetical protein
MELALGVSRLDIKDKTLDGQPAYGSVGKFLPVLREKIEY